MGADFRPYLFARTLKSGQPKTMRLFSKSAMGNLISEREYPNVKELALLTR